MTKKDYQLIAKSIYTINNKYLNDGQAFNKYLMMDLLEEVAKELADSMITNNPRFNRSKFLEACGLEN
jgi:hypothetical protein